MSDDETMFDTSLAGLKRNGWLQSLKQVTTKNGRFDQLDSKHFAALIEGGLTLLVTFETMQSIRALDEKAHPLGWDYVRQHGWSHLALISDGDTWFRNDNVYAYFDRLVDDGFFDEFEQVVFFGAGPCGYAACAYSVAAPGATVLAIQPQATLSPEVAGWDERFSEERRRDFTTRYGYAPDMIDACRQAFVMYDPTVSLDAMHAALFTKSNVTKLPMRRMGATILPHLMEMRLLHPILHRAGERALSRRGFAQLMRARRDYPPYLRNLMSHLNAEERDGLIEMLCKNVTSRMKAPRFERRLRDLHSAKAD